MQETFTANQTSDSSSSKHCLLILGMHRSGTSALTRLFSIAGAELPKRLMEAGDGNAAGHWEPDDLVAYHDRMLAEVGSAWHDWKGPDFARISPERRKAICSEIGTIIEANFPHGKLIAIKDPRICRFVPIIRDALENLGYQIVPVLIFRNPLDVAKSLQKRVSNWPSGFNKLDAMLLWLRHVLDAEAETRRYPRIFLTYDNLINDWRGVLEKVSFHTGVAFPNSDSAVSPQVENFISSKLRHHSHSVEDLEHDADLPSWIAAAYRALRALEAEPESPEALNELNKVRADFGWALTVMDRALRPTEVQRIRAEQACSEYKTALETIEGKHKAELSRIRRDSAEYRSKAQALENTPLKAGAKAISWGLMRIGYHKLPIPQTAKYRLVNRLGKFIERVRPFPLNDPAGRYVGLPSNSEVKSFRDTSKIVFEALASPDVSIVIPVYNQIGHTLNCLKSLCAHDTSVQFEVIVMDDCSSDETQRLLSKLPGLHYVRNTSNLGFIRNCNKAAGLARGKFLVFLNNDTFVLPGWLDNLYATFAQNDNIGLVGSKLIYPNGKLQEAGGIIWRDASGWNWGRLQDPDHPNFNFLRDVDYCSGASVMIPRDLFEKLGMFDERYVPAYYEDTDLAFAVREAGLRTVYQPKSELIHYEGITSGTDIKRGIKQHQTVNAKKFQKKWDSVLREQGSPGNNPAHMSDRHSRGHVLIVDAETPRPDHDSGSNDLVNLMKILLSMGYRVHFIPETNFAHSGRYTDDLQRIGVNCVYLPYYRQLSDYLLEQKDLFDLVILCREPIASKTLDTVRTLAPKAKVVFNTVDLHFLRIERQASIKNEPHLFAEAVRMKKSELNLIKRCDLTILLSEAEQNIIQSELPNAQTTIIPLIREFTGRTGALIDREGVVFIGGYNHPPNVDAVEWLVAEVWPALRAKGANIRLKICGSNMPRSFEGFATDDIEVIGFVDDLDALFRTCRLSVAPLRYGAGLKGKLATSLGYGVPCVATSIAVEGMPEEGFGSARLVANGATNLAELIFNLYFDQETWEAASRDGLQYVQQHFSRDAVSDRVEKVMKNLLGRKL